MCDCITITPNTSCYTARTIPHTHIHAHSERFAVVYYGDRVSITYHTHTKSIIVHAHTHEKDLYRYSDLNVCQYRKKFKVRYCPLNETFAKF